MDSAFKFKLHAIGASLNLVFAFIAFINQQWLTMLVFIFNLVLFAKVATDNDYVKAMTQSFLKK